MLSKHIKNIYLHFKWPCWYYFYFDFHRVLNSWIYINNRFKNNFGIAELNLNKENWNILLFIDMSYLLTFSCLLFFNWDIFFSLGKRCWPTKFSRLLAPWLHLRFSRLVTKLSLILVDLYFSQRNFEILAVFWIVKLFDLLSQANSFFL